MNIHASIQRTIIIMIVVLPILVIIHGSFNYSAHFSAVQETSGWRVTSSESAINVTLIGLSVYTALFCLWCFYDPPIKPPIETMVVSLRRQVVSLMIDYLVLNLVIHFVRVLTRLTLEALFTGEWLWQWDQSHAWRDSFAIPIALGLAAVAFVRLMKRIAQGRPTIGQFLMQFRLITDPSNELPSKGRRLAAYLAIFQPGEDLTRRMRFRYDAKAVRSQPPIVRAVSTRAP